MTLALVLDGTDGDRSVEAAATILEALAGRGDRATRGRPPRVLVDTGGLMPHDLTNSPKGGWWVNDLDWSDDEDEVITRADGHRILQYVTVTLLQYVDETRLADRAHAASLKLKAKQKQSGANRTYTVKEGEDLITIARDRLGDAGKWEILAELNDIRDPRSVRRGAVIKVP